MKRRRIALILAGGALLAALAGCASPASPRTATAAASAPQAEGYHETQETGAGKVTLALYPARAGSNKLTVTLDSTEATAVEAQLIMADMGHGTVVPLQPAGPGRYEAPAANLEMDGRWMIRIKATLPSGETREARFTVNVKPG